MTSDAAVVVDSRGSHVDVPAARDAPPRSSASPTAGRRALKAAATCWFVVAALGQAMFATAAGIAAVTLMLWLPRLS